MKVRYQQLFSIAMLSSYYTDHQSREVVQIAPTRDCLQLLQRFRMLTRKQLNGILVAYTCHPATQDNTPFLPVLAVEKLTFKVTVSDPDFWLYTDVRNWESGKVFLLKNAHFNTTGDIPLHNGPLVTPMLFRPMQFKYPVPLDPQPALLQVLDAQQNVIHEQAVRARTPLEPAGHLMDFEIDLKFRKEGTYIIRHKGAGGTNDVSVYCSRDYSPDTLAMIEVRYMSGAGWTGVEPFQRFLATIPARSSNWIYDIHIGQRTVPAYLASQLAIRHIPGPSEPLCTFSVAGVADDAGGFVRFASDTQLRYSQTPIHLQLVRVPSTTVLDPLPLPSAVHVQKDAANNLLTVVVISV